jgi:hypothetical protein
MRAHHVRHALRRRAQADGTVGHGRDDLTGAYVFRFTVMLMKF